MNRDNKQHDPFYPLTPNAIAGGLDQYVGFLLTNLQEAAEEKSSELDKMFLFELCSPGTDLTALNIPSSLADLKEEYESILQLFQNPKAYFYKSNPQVHNDHIPELQHALRRILLRRLLKESIIDVNSSLEAIHATLRLLKTEAATLPKIKTNRQKCSVTKIVSTVGMVTCFLSSLSVTMKSLYSIAKEFATTKKDITFNDGALAITLVILFLATIMHTFIETRKALPKTIVEQLGTSIGSFEAYEEQIKNLVHNLLLSDAKAENSSARTFSSSS